MGAFLRRAIAWFGRRGVRVPRVRTDNGSGYVSRVFAAVCRALTVQHLRTRPYNWHRRHGSLEGRPPIRRLVTEDNLSRLHN